MEWIKAIGMAGFLFFLIKGLIWLGLFAAIYFGLVKKEKIAALKAKLRWKKSN